MTLEPLLLSDAESQRVRKRGQWKASPYWLIPVVMVASMARGMTLAPRIQVYTDIACQAIGGPPMRDEAISDCSLPAVQAHAARIQAYVTTVMSVLSAITTGPWSRYGDFHGRKPVLFLTLSGALTMELIFILVTTPNTIFSTYAEQVIIMGPVLDGLVGGLSAFNGVVHAYTSDCTEHGSRSKIFSTMQGIVFCGLALGPWFGGLILKVFDKTTYLLFYVSVGMLLALLVFLVFLCPESLENRASSSYAAPPDTSNVAVLRFRKLSLSHIKRYTIQVLTAFVTPIAIFFPRAIPGNPSKKDYNLTFLGTGLFIYLISIGVYQIKYIYGKHVYEWTATQLGFYMSLLWVTRAINLLILLPILISYFKPKRSNTDSNWIYAEMRFDRILARCSLAVDASADALVALSPSSSQTAFVAFSCLSSFTSGGNPTMHSLGAVCLHASGRSSDVGSLFGGMAVLSAIAHTISPAIYAVTYSYTVEYMPKAIFWLAAALLTTTVLLLGRVGTDDSLAAAYRPIPAEVEIEGDDEIAD